MKMNYKSVLDENVNCSNWEIYPVAYCDWDSLLKNC